MAVPAEGDNTALLSVLATRDKYKLPVIALPTLTALSDYLSKKRNATEEKQPEDESYQYKYYIFSKGNTPVN